MNIFLLNTMDCLKELLFSQRNEEKRSAFPHVNDNIEKIISFMVFENY